MRDSVSLHQGTGLGAVGSEPSLKDSKQGSNMINTLGSPGGEHVGARLEIKGPVMN